MNQILSTKMKNRKIIKVLKIQFIVSIIFIILGIIYIVKILKEKEKQNNISNIISLNAKLNSVFSSNNDNNVDKVYFGRIVCEKIGLDYYVYNNYSEENLKILPCKFSGGELEESSNICIIGHNYFDNRFFSNLNKLEVGDVIFVNDLKNNTYKYYVYKKFEINEGDTQSVLKQEKERELTLCTCTFNKKKRLVIKLELS